MLARRIIAVSPDKGFGKQLATALKAAGGAVDLHLTLEELGTAEIQAALVVIHLDGELASAAAALLPRLHGEARVICILPRSNLAAVVDTMQSSDRVAGLLTTENFDSRELSSLATRVLAGDIFGLEKMIHWGTFVHSQLVGDYQEKSVAISQISEFAELMGVRRKYRESIEQCVDEMLMNALYDAPVDEHGQPLFSEIPTKTRISLRVEQKVVVQYACDGKRFAVSVRDGFGTLERATVLRYLHKCLHSEQQIDRKVGGAGLGLYMMVNAASCVLFNVLPGIATEVVCVFDLEMPKMQLEQIGFFHEKIDAAGRLATGPSKRLPGTAHHPVERRQVSAPGVSPLLVRVLVAAIVVMCGLIGFVAGGRIFGAKQTTEVSFSTSPEGAQIELEGHNVGSTTGGSLAIADLEVGRAYAVVARHEGYVAKHEVIQPRAGGTRVAIQLTALAATVDVDTTPTGATIEIDGAARGRTPLALTTLAPSTAVAITFKKSGYQAVTTKLEVPGPGQEVRIVQPLSVNDELARVRLSSDPTGAAITQNGQLLAGVVTPAEVLVEGGKPVRFVIALAHRVPAVIDAFTPPRGADGIEKHVKLADGATLHVEANVDGKVTITGAPHCQALAVPADCVLAKGTYTLDFTGPARVTREVALGDQGHLERIELGFIDAGPGKHLLAAPGVMVQHLALEAGSHQVTVSDDAGTHVISVRVEPGTTILAN
ncbi:hypothetical protein BH11MYX1_BH11MYX1_46280 [soil metagenome]